MIEKAAFDMAEELIEIRHMLHENPEIGGVEYKTSALIGEKLKEYGIPFSVMNKTGVKGVIAGHGGGKTVLLRADIDALPISEESGVSYASKNDGFMHACGHDIHTAALLGAACILNTVKDKLNGNVVLVFQPNEEGDGGALPMISEGVMDNPRVDAAFAMHVEPLEETGNIQIKDGAIMASPDDFEIIIRGTGGHGAYPEKCVNPIDIGAEIVRRYNREIVNDIDKQAVSICSFNGGSCRNAIPDTVTVTGTARSLDNETRFALKEQLQRIAEETAEEMGGRAEFDFNVLFPPVINNAQMNKIVIEAGKRLKCVDKVVTLPRAAMTGDDFAYFAEKVPSSYFKLGVGNKDIGAVYPLHSPRFAADDNAIAIGAAMLAQIAAEYLNN